jgi:hypothetical protein
MARRKGHSFERHVAILFQSIFPGARRQLEYHSDDAKGIDIAGTGVYKVQCKRYRDYAPVAKINEVQCDREFGEVPILVTAGDHKEPMAVLPLEDLLQLIERVERAG